MAASLKDTTVDEIELRLDALDPHAESDQRTNVLTHMAWVPPEWSRAAGRVLKGLGPRIPSRTLMLHPDPKAGADRLDAELEHECFPEAGHNICAEVVHLRLLGRTAKAPASIVVPLQLPDLPVFLRWRAGLAELWPGIRAARVLHVTGPSAEAFLLAGWLRSRLRRKITLRRRNATSVTEIEVDGTRVEPARLPFASGSDLLSEQLELHVRDPVYEAAVRAV